MTITLYASAGCAGCRMTERVLKKHGADFQIKDAKQSTDYLKGLGFSSVPVVVPDSGEEHAWSGFREEKITAAIHDQDTATATSHAETSTSDLIQQAGLDTSPDLTATNNSAHSDAADNTDADENAQQMGM